MSDLDLLIELIRRMTGTDLTGSLPEAWDPHFVVIELQFNEGKFQRADVY